LGMRSLRILRKDSTGRTMNEQLIGPVKAALQHMANGQYMHAQFTLRAAVDRLDKEAVQQACADPYTVTTPQMEHTHETFKNQN
jgi:hypothetical protein